MSGALADVLAAITDRPVGHWRAEVASPAFLGIDRISSRGVQWRVRVEPYRSTTQTRRATLRSTEPAYEARRVGNTLTRVEVSPAHTITPAEAVEALAGLWPWSPGDGPRWWCEFLNDTIIDDPPSLAALVAVASLGVERLRAAEGLTQEIAAHAGCREARLVWRVMGREEIEAHHVRICSDQAWRGGSPTLPEVASVEEAIRIDGGAWPWHAAEDWSDSTARAAWPALRDLHALGLHLVALDASRIVLAVEAIGGDRG